MKFIKEVERIIVRIGKLCNLNDSIVEKAITDNEFWKEGRKRLLAKISQKLKSRSPELAKTVRLYAICVLIRRYSDIVEARSLGKGNEFANTLINSWGGTIPNGKIVTSSICT